MWDVNQSNSRIVHEVGCQLRSRGFKFPAFLVRVADSGSVSDAADTVYRIRFFFFILHAARRCTRCHRRHHHLLVTGVATRKARSAVNTQVPLVDIGNWFAEAYKLQLKRLMALRIPVHGITDYSHRSLAELQNLMATAFYRSVISTDQRPPVLYPSRI